jgi:hypothetical protein
MITKRTKTEQFGNTSMNRIQMLCVFLKQTPRGTCFLMSRGLNRELAVGFKNQEHSLRGTKHTQKSSLLDSGVELQS